jgi:hypothetical protein
METHAYEEQTHTSGMDSYWVLLYSLCNQIGRGQEEQGECMELHILNTWLEFTVREEG